MGDTVRSRAQKLAQKLRTPATSTGETRPVSVRLPLATVERLDGIVDLAKSKGHPDVTRSFIVRDALGGYASEFESEFEDQL